MVIEQNITSCCLSNSLPPFVYCRHHLPLLFFSSLLLPWFNTGENPNLNLLSPFVSCRRIYFKTRTRFGPLICVLFFLGIL